MRPGRRASDVGAPGGGRPMSSGRCAERVPAAAAPHGIRSLTAIQVPSWNWSGVPQVCRSERIRSRSRWTRCHRLPQHPIIPTRGLADSLGLPKSSRVRIDGGEGEIRHATGAYTSGDYDAARLRGVARRTKSAARGVAFWHWPRFMTAVRARRLPALVGFVLRFNAHGPEGLTDRQAPGHPGKLNTAQREALAARVESGPMPAIHGVVRWRLKDLAMWVWEEFRVSVSETTLSRMLRALGYRKLSARPRHHAQAAGAVDAFKKRSPSAWTRSRATRDRSRPDRGLVRGRGPDRAEEQDHPALGTTGNAALGAARSAHRFHLHLRGYLPRRWQGSRARPARLQHRGDEPAPRRNRRRSGSRQARRTRRRPGRMAPLGRPRASRQHHARGAPAQMPGAQPRRERLAVHAR